MKKKVISLCLCAVMLAIAVIGGTLAYFTDTTDEVTNTFSMAGNGEDDDAVAITLDEAKIKYDSEKKEWIVDPEAKDRVTENEYENVYPGAKLPKDPTIHNVGNYDAYVRMDVTITKAAAFTALFNEYNLDMDKIFPDYNKNWARYAEKADTEADTLTYSYIWTDGNGSPAVLATEKSTEAIFKTVVIPVAFDADDMADIDGFEISAFGYGIQADGAEVDTLITELKAMTASAASEE